jgi:hypothetical protein
VDERREWLRVVDAARLLGESPATVRRHGRQGLLTLRQRGQGGRVLEVEAAGVWKMRADRLAALGLASDPLHPESRCADPMALVAQLAEAETERARLAGRVEVLEAELARVREALSLTMAADEVSEDRARTWKGVARALAGTDDFPLVR